MMKNHQVLPFLPVAVIAITAAVGCRQSPLQKRWRLPNPPLPPARSPAQSSERGPSESRLAAELEDKMDAVYRHFAELSFEAELTRWTKEETTKYLAFARMKPDGVDTRVRDFDTNRLVAGVADGVENLYEPEVDTCLFGTLYVSWIGPAADPPYTGRIRAGRMIEFIAVPESGYRISYRHGQGVTEVYLVDAKSFLLREWSSFHSAPEGEQKPWMVVTRKYRYHEPPAMLSAKIEKGEDR